MILCFEAVSPQFENHFSQVWHDSPEGVWEAQWCHACDGRGAPWTKGYERTASVLSIQKLYRSWKTLKTGSFDTLLALEIRRHSIILYLRTSGMNLFFLGGGRGKSKIRFGGWMSWGGMDERWATEDVAWDFAPWDHKDDSCFDLGEPEKNQGGNFSFLEVFDDFWHIQTSK